MKNIIAVNSIKQDILDKYPKAVDIKIEYGEFDMYTCTYYVGNEEHYLVTTETELFLHAIVEHDIHPLMYPHLDNIVNRMVKNCPSYFNYKEIFAILALDGAELNYIESQLKDKVSL